MPTEQLPGVMQNIGLALLTVFIPVAIYLFEKREGDYAVLDGSVFLNYVVNASLLLGEFGLIFLPLLFWDVATSPVKKFIIFLWSIGAMGVVVVIVKTFKWMKNNKYDFRFEYLESVENTEELEDLWRSVWEAKDINLQNEKRFFLIFSQKVDKIIISENLQKLNILAKLLDDFQILIKKRNFLFITGKDDVFAKILDWHVQAWIKDYSHMQSHSELYGACYEIKRILNSIIDSLTIRALQDPHPYGFFKILEDHVAKNLDNKVLSAKNTYFYIENLIPSFSRVFFNNISEAQQRYDIWGHYFKWKISIDKIRNGDKISLIVLNEFFEWAKDRIQNGPDEDKFDKALDNVAKELFPETDPRLWAIILTFMIRPWGDSRMGSLIEGYINFGFIGRIYSGFVEDKQEFQESFRKNLDVQTESTIELALVVFGNYLTKDIVLKNLQELEKLSYDDEKKEGFRKELLGYFKMLLKKIEEISSTTNP